MATLGYRTTTHMIESYYFKSREDEWIEDDQQKTDWEGYGLPAPDEVDTIESINSNSSNNISDTDTLPTSQRKPFSMSGLTSSFLNLKSSSSTANRADHQRLSQSSTFPTNSKILAENIQRRKRISALRDRQYMHRTAISCIRVGSEGFVWLINVSSRVSDISSTQEKDKEYSNMKLNEFQRVCDSITVSYGVLLEIIEAVWKITEETNTTMPLDNSRE
jgi:hypothetical protein